MRLDSALLDTVSHAGSNTSEILFPHTLLNRLPPIYIADRIGNFTLLSPEFEEFMTAAFDTRRSEDGRFSAPEELLGIFRHLEKGVTEVKLRQAVEIGGDVTVES